MDKEEILKAINEQRTYYRSQLVLLDGAIAALDELEAKLFPRDAMTTDELAEAMNARLVEVVEGNGDVD